jgi:hypothetical protein
MPQPRATRVSLLKKGKVTKGDNRKLCIYGEKGFVQLLKE